MGKEVAKRKPGGTEGPGVRGCHGAARHVGRRTLLMVKQRKEKLRGK